MAGATRTAGSPPTVGGGLWSRPGVIACLGAVLLWLSQPPLDWNLLAWIALTPWTLLVLRPQPLERRVGWWLWLAGMLYWLATMQGVRLAHPALYPGWFVLAAYLGVYPLLFVGLSRVAVHRWRWPPVMGVPVMWSGLEWIRSYAFTGFSGTLLGHSQVDRPLVVQIADLGGTYVVSFLLAAVAAVAAVMWDWGWRWWRARGEAADGATPRPPLKQLGTIVCLLISMVVYGKLRLASSPSAEDARLALSALLVQRDEPLIFSIDPNRESEVFQNYVQSTLQAVADHRREKIDLIIWPESMFTGGLPYRILEDPYEVPQQVDVSPQEFAEAIRNQQQAFVSRNRWIQTSVSEIMGDVAPPLLMGCSVYRYAERAHAHGAAVLINSRSEVDAWYGKRHLVMFGEYVPFGDWLPWLYDWTPLSYGASPGPKPMSLPINGAEVAPSICFETMVEHVTGNGLRTLRSEGANPDVIINLTNDAWFHGTAILDHHRRCSQMVALINRRPLLMCANQGPTAWIDGNGQVVQSLPRLTNGHLLARPLADNRDSLYRHIGDALCWPFALACTVAAFSGWRERRRRGKDAVA